MQKDPTWDAFLSTYSFETFCEDAIPPIFLKAEVHQDVQQNFHVVRKLLEHSYFEYKFYDIAASHAILTLEMALRIRYKEVLGKPCPDKQWLKPLFDLFFKQKYFEVYDQEFLKYMVELRNSVAHPDKHTIYGPFSRGVILYCVDLINDLYESPELRVERMKLMKEIGDKIRQINSNGYKVSFANGSYQLAFIVKPIFINNKKVPTEIYISYRPLFDIPETREKGKIYQYPTIKLVTNNIQFLNDGIALLDVELGKIKISGVNNDVDLERFKFWGERFIQYDHETREIAHLNMEDAESYLAHLREFHFTK